MSTVTPPDAPAATLPSDSAGTTHSSDADLASSGPASKSIWVKLWDPTFAQGKRYATRFLDATIRPSVITVLITAIAGPLAVKWTADKIENKKLQAQVIESVLEYTSKADFSDPKQVARAGMIAGLVHENQDVFGLRFENAEIAFSKLARDMERSGLVKLHEENATYQATVNDLTAKAKNDSLRAAGLREANANIQQQLDRDQSLNEAQKSALRASLDQNSRQITSLDSQRSTALMHVGELNAQLTANRAELDKVSASLAGLQRDYATNQAELRAQTERAQRFGNDLDSLRTSLGDVTVKWRAATTQLEAWRTQAESEKNRADRADSLAASLQRQLTELRTPRAENAVNGTS